MKINSILIGKGSGSAGNVTVVQLKGQTILKQKASIVSNPRTALQQNQRKVITRAVFAWQLLGNVLKQGITSLLPHSSQYNTYVSMNAEFFKSATFTKENFTMRNIADSQATKGSLGELSSTIDERVSGAFGIAFNKANLSSIAKVGDKIVLILGQDSSDTASYSEVIVTAPLLASTNPVAVFDLVFDDQGDDLVWSCFLVSEDGRKSTSADWKIN